ncbi:MAG: hypothetical protein M3O62_09120, partial [Pseudomonadota bacterium]|nr:hypothetical protein [Pseudomonadota bacterium]
MNIINASTVKKATGHDLTIGAYDSLGTADGLYEGRVLTFLDNRKFAETISRNKNIKGSFVKEEDAHLLSPDIEKIIVDDPRWFFFSVVSYLGATRVREKSNISPKATIHPSAVIASSGVIIEDGVVIDPGVVVMPDVTLCAGVIVRAGAIIGSDGYEHKRTSRGV